MSGPETLSTKCFVESEPRMTRIGVSSSGASPFGSCASKLALPHQIPKLIWRLLKRGMSGLKRLRGLFLLIVVLGFCSVALAQQPLPFPSPSPSPAQATETARPLYGFQGVLVETLDGKVISSQSENEQFNPASTLKLATALVALKTLGPAHRFATGVWHDGVLDKATGKLT